MNHRYITTFLCVMATVNCSLHVNAQGLSVFNSGDQGGSGYVERSKILERAKESFEHKIDDILSSSSESDHGPQLRENLRRVADDFYQKMSNELISLEGDGLLGAGEVESEIGSLRDEYERELLTVASATRSGFRPPPLRRDFESTAEYSLALAKYSILTRNPPTTWLIFFTCIAVGVGAAWALNLAAKKSATTFHDHEQDSMSNVAISLGGPLYLTAVSLGLYFGIQNLWIPHVVAESLNGLVDVLLIGALFWLFWNATPGIAAAISQFIRTSYNHEFDSHAENIILRVLRLLVLSALFIVIIKVILGTSLTKLLAGLGLFGLALYFILRSTLENVAASFTIFGDEPFRVDDLVIYKGDWGHIEKIGFRSTKFRTLTGHLVTIPNDELIKESVHNVGARPWIRRRFRLGLTYDTPPDKIEESDGNYSRHPRES